MPSTTRACLPGALLVAIAVAVGPGPARAQGGPGPGPGASDVAAPQLSELSSDTVFAVSKRLQHTQEAPAIVRVFTQQQILRAGFRNLNELLASIPEVELVDTGRYQYLLIKGAPFTVLALLDGVSLVNHFDNTVDLERLVPLEIVQKVEVVLSPGGVLWGAHSVYGVVNIITKQPLDQHQQRVSVTGGSWRTLRAAYSLASAWSDLLWQAHLSVESYRGATVELDHAPLALPDHFESGVQTENDTGLSFNAFGALRWRGWFARALAQVLDQHPYAIHEGTGARARRGENGVIQIPTLQVTAGYERTLQWRKLGLRLLGEAYVYNQPYYDRSFAYPKSSLLPEGELVIERTERRLQTGTNIEAQARYHPSTTTLGFDLSCTSSSVTEDYFEASLHESREEVLPAVSSYAGSVYAQEELQLHRDVNLAVGARVNLSDSYSTALLLHGHGVYEPFDGFFIKANYSEGFRPPSYEQRFLDAPWQKGNESLSPEQSRVVELQLSHVTALGGRTRLELTGGYTYARFSGLIGPVQDEMLWVFRNLRDEQMHSVSFLGRAHVKHLFSAGVYAAAHFPVESDAGETREDFARLRIAADATMVYFKPFTVTVRYGYTGRRRLVDYFDPVEKIPVDLDVDAYHELSLAVRMRLYRMPLYLSGTLRNLLCDDHDHIPAYTHDENAYRGPFPQPAAAHGFLSLEWVHDL